MGCNVYVLGRSKEIWGDDANEWKPERWMPNADDLDGKMDRKMQDGFAVFGRGSRACKGKDIAWMLLSEAIAGVCGDVCLVYPMKDANVGRCAPSGRLLPNPEV